MRLQGITDLSRESSSSRPRPCVLLDESVLSFTQKDLDPSLALYGQAPSSYSIFRERNGRRPLSISAVAARANTAIQRTQLIQLIQLTQMTQTPLRTHQDPVTRKATYGTDNLSSRRVHQ